MKTLKARAKSLICAIDVDGHIDKNGFHLNFQDKAYRQEELVKLLRNSIVNFALTPAEIDKFTKLGDYGEMTEEAWNRLSKVKASRKGDYGEILLFLLLETFFEVPKFATKVRLKSNLRDQVKGYDCAHFTENEGNIELWLGEAKLHKTFSSAISDAVLSLNAHLRTEYLEDEFSILKGNIDLSESDPLREKIETLLRSKKPIHEYKIVIPTLLAYEWANIKELREKTIDEIKESFETHFKGHFETLVSKVAQVKTEFRLLFMCLPLEDLDDFRLKIEEAEKSNR